MRIAGYIEHPDCKITVFKTGTKFAVKLETGLYEQTFKIREHRDIEGLDDIKKLITVGFINKCLERFTRMHGDMNDCLIKFLPSGEDEFEEII